MLLRRFFLSTSLTKQVRKRNYMARPTQVLVLTCPIFVLYFRFLLGSWFGVRRFCPVLFFLCIDLGFCFAWSYLVCKRDEWDFFVG